jgi:ATP-binding cassette subfamily B protein
LLNQKASMLTGLWRELSDPKGAAASIRRLVIEHGTVHWPRYLLSFGCMGVAAFCTSAVAYLVGYGADQGYVHQSLQGVALAGLLFIVAFVLRGAAIYGRAVTLARIGNHIVADYQRRMFDKLIRQDVAFFGNRHSSEFAARVSFGAASPAQVLDLLINALGRDLLTLVSLTCLMVAQAPIPSAIALVVVPTAVLGVRRVKKVHDIALAQFVGGAEIHKVIQELVQGSRIVKAFNLEEIVRTEARNGIAAIEHAANKHASISSRLTPLIDLLTGTIVGLMFVYGGYRILVLGTAPGEFLSFLSAFLLAVEPAKRIARLNFELHGALAGVQVLFEVLDLPDAPQAAPKGDAKVGRERIEFDRVSFAYRADNPVLRQVSFVAQPGEVTAFV